MASKPISIQTKRESSRYDIVIARDSLHKCGAWAKECLGGYGKVGIVSNAKVFGLYGENVGTSLESAGFDVSVFLMKDGERYKSLRSLQGALEFFSKSGLTRGDAVIALGGGVVGDLAGFAASVYLRGIPFLQAPTTLLAMIDSSVGGKTAVNTSFGKNLVGAFYQPRGVLIDVGTLKTLPRRELTAGFCECVKQGAISGHKLLRKTADLLEDYPVGAFKNYFTADKFLSSLEDLIHAQVAFKASIVKQDETEQIDRTDAGSRKILNFGHTLAHALEKVTGYKYFKHGEAVGYGIIFAAELSKRLELLSQNELNLLNDVMRRVGKLPDVGNIDVKEIFEAFKFDKKSTGKSLQWILLKAIGEPAILSDKDISLRDKQNALKKILNR
jgi:3-dehydroquinate synthase